MTTDILRPAFAGAEQVLADVQPEQLGDPTPCSSWDVRALVNHMVRNSYFCGQTAQAGEPVGPHEADFAGGDFLSDYREGARQSLAILEEPGILDRDIVMPFGEIPCSLFVIIAATDHFVHGWDLVRATDQESALDPALAEELLARIRPLVSADFRGPDGQAPFGPERPVPPAAPTVDRLAAFLGRSVGGSAVGG